MSDKPMHIWKVTVRSLAICRSDRHTASFLVALSATDEKTAAHQIKTCKFTPGWWDEHLMTDIEDMGELWYAESPLRGKVNQ